MEGSVLRSLVKMLPGLPPGSLRCYPESILLGASAMREPYLLTFSAFALWGFVNLFHRAPEEHQDRTHSERLDLACAWLAGHVACFTGRCFGDDCHFCWVDILCQRASQISWKVIVAIAVVFILGLFILSSPESLR